MFSSLRTLHIEKAGILQMQFDRSWVARTFPALRELVLSRCFFGSATLVSLIDAFSLTLEQLTLWMFRYTGQPLRANLAGAIRCRSSTRYVTGVYKTGSKQPV